MGGQANTTVNLKTHTASHRLSSVTCTCRACSVTLGIFWLHGKTRSGKSNKAWEMPPDNYQSDEEPDGTECVIVPDIKDMCAIHLYAPQERNEKKTNNRCLIISKQTITYIL